MENCQFVIQRSQRRGYWLPAQPGGGALCHSVLPLLGRQSDMWEMFDGVWRKHCKQYNNRRQILFLVQSAYAI